VLRPLAQRADGYRLFEIESFDDLDLTTLLPMLDAAWRLDYAGQSRLDFDGAVLRKLMPARWWVGVLATAPDGSPVGFEIALERTLRAADETFRCFYASVFSVAAEHRRKGLGRFVLEGINQLVFERRGGDLILSTFHEGHAGSPVVQSTFDRIPGWGVVRFHSSPIWSRRLDRNPLPPLDRAPAFLDLRVTTDRAEHHLRAIEARVPASFSSSFAISESLSGQYLDPQNAASGITLYEPESSDFGLTAWNVLPMAIDDRKLRPIGQLQLVLPGSPAGGATVEAMVHDTALRLAERGCFAMTMLDLGVVPHRTLEKLGFAPSDTTITLAARGPLRNVEAFAGLRPPFFLDFT
jgi:hypothetical protein